MQEKSLTNCSSVVEQFKEDLRKIIVSKFSEGDSSKFLELLNKNQNDKILDPNEKKENNVLNQNLPMPMPMPILKIDPCKLSKLEGNCTDRVERYFYDEISQRCVIFVYSGCNGNENNFETLDLCEKACKTKKLENLTPLAVNRDHLVKP